MDTVKYDFSRLFRCMQRAERGEELTIGFFGGSITQGSLATKPEFTYAYRVFQWWQKSLPKAEFLRKTGATASFLKLFFIMVRDVSIGSKWRFFRIRRRNGQSFI